MSAGGVGRGPSSSRSQRTQRPSVVFVDRDYRQGMDVLFLEAFPDELEGLIDREKFQQIISSVNQLFAEGQEIGWREIGRGLLELVPVVNILLQFVETKYEKKMKELEEYIEMINRNHLNKMGVRMYHPMQNGYRYVKMTYGHVAQIAETSV